MEEGWVKLHRKSKKSAAYHDELTWKIWTTLLMDANWEERQLLNGETLQRGELIIGLAKFSQDLRTTIKKLRSRLNQLASCENLALKGTSTGTHVTIYNYTYYQGDQEGKGQVKGQAEGKRRASGGQAEGKRRATEEELKKERSKEGKKKILFVPPTIDEIKAYCKERKNGLDGEHIWAHYEKQGWVQGNGQKVKSWKACVITWEKNQGGQQQLFLGGRGDKTQRQAGGPDRPCTPI